ncbi:DNA/RNA helicase domain-containing protein [Roseomonas sp. CECT 9278]|uniref:DNA/RNA helicase domain-containing protein n=1 Tax=Roseomonas sp. CECT 9278 TaxID=2845823 RepID=UPI001E406CE5|nr:DNA/RNA helicase domain-containing protein [Roseomonas sp. CECT 9278]CAH0310260.1 hypothetical protein ROS9278_04902 [Roseomonas sp. CECT 9278]
MRAWFHCTGAELLARDPDEVVGVLAAEQQRRGYSGAADQDGAWRDQLAALRRAVGSVGGEDWTIVLEFELTRLERRIDAVILTDRAIVCCEFKAGELTPSRLREVDEYAMRLRDFHEGSRSHSIYPLLAAGSGPFVRPSQAGLPLVAMHQPLATGSAGLGDALRWIALQEPPPSRPLDGRAWLDARYLPVPGIVEAARRLFARHDVLELGVARADAGNLTRTGDAIRRAIGVARSQNRRIAVFVTGIPGAGKTLCGLDTVFRSDTKTAFLSGNAPLIEVLREALARDAVAQGATTAAASERVEGFIQNIHRFLESHAEPGAPPPEEVIVFDEAQRAWDQAKATRKTQNRKSKLFMSEPAHALDIMGRRDDWAVIVALIGNGQEINTGEAGLREWGRAIAAHGGWEARVAARGVSATDPRQCIGSSDAPWIVRDDDLDLVVPIRSVRSSSMAAWVEAVLDNDVERAASLAAVEPPPVLVTRELPAARAALRVLARGQRRAGFVRASGGRRLRAEGLAAEVSLKEVANWFLERFPDDIRASDALEAAATEYACQGLELDVVGLGWDLDLRRSDGRWTGWRIVGKKWHRELQEFDYVLNTYRVLLTRARYETVIWVPHGSPRDDPFHDATRDAAAYDAIAAFLLACGARPLEALDAPPARAEPATLL